MADATFKIGTEQVTTSGTEWDFTIPSGVKRITLMLKGFSTNGTSIPIIQLGDAGGIETSGYLGTGAASGGSNTIETANYTAGFGLAGATAWTAARVAHGTIILNLQDASDFTWTCTGQLGTSDAAFVLWTAGSKALSAELTTVRLTMVNGTDAGDAGAANVSWEY